MAFSVVSILVGVHSYLPSRKEADVSKKPSKATKLVVALFAFVFATWCLAVLAGNYMQLSVISSFKRDLRILAPYIDDDHEERLLSEWSQMRSEEDYERIRRALNEIAEAHGIDFTENAIYSPFSI